MVRVWGPHSERGARNYTVSQKKRSHFYFSNNSVNNQPILMIFGMLNPEKIWHQQLVHLPTSPVYCSHFTLGNPKKVIFQQYYSFTEHVNGAGAAEFPLTAQTLFCDSRSPLCDLPLPLRSRSSQFFHTRSPLRSRSPDFWPAPLQLRSSPAPYVSSSKRKSGPIFTAGAAMIARY